jgi:hypothetical protein
MTDKLYSFVMRGELSKAALEKTDTVEKHSVSDKTVQQYTQSLSWNLLDEDKMSQAILMSTVYAAIAAFENMVRDFVAKILLENKGEDWWEKSVSEKIRTKAESRKKEEEKIKWHSSRGVSLLNYSEFGDLSSIMSQNYEFFEDYIVSVEWVRQIFSTLERSRNVIMHSGELGRRDIERVGTNIRDWISQVGG